MLNDQLYYEVLLLGGPGDYALAVSVIVRTGSTVGRSTVLVKCYGRVNIANNWPMRLAWAVPVC